MIFNIKTKRFSLTEGLAKAVEYRMEKLLANSKSGIQRIDISLSDDNGPKGGIDMVCKIKCFIVGKSEAIHVKSLSVDMYDAIGKSFNKINRAILRNKKRKTLRSKDRYDHLIDATLRAKDQNKGYDEENIINNGKDFGNIDSHYFASQMMKLDSRNKIYTDSPK